eukprot:CAMPEP_0202505918 /NCGR_PEP_ID=MMETSP1361-20130828/48669_1 /ASSEMBLY_ACC=CAM_ASM_000849 /TAXON_ID=210615 /ORGANISM="Staurosira complex sp., Strain CCMP2646" /LENGTH=56 /DNA_ID=CAMNT_0049139785 /DNA_START=26 /DNA_END=193 /DNA_ORIENTATION=+
MTRITLDHLVQWLEHRVGDLGNSQTLVVGDLSRDNWSVCEQREADTWVWYQVSLEL